MSESVAEAIRACRSCGSEHPESHYPKHRRQCRACRTANQRRYVERNREAVYARNKEWRQADRNQKRSHLARLYGITLEQYDEMLETQAGVCAICKQVCPSGRHLAVDHDHATGRVRGLLCGKCNPMLGYASDNPEVLETAAKYLRSLNA